MGLGLLVQYDTHPDACLSPQRWNECLGQRMHQPQHLAYDDRIRIQLFGLLLRVACYRLGSVFEYMLNVGYTDPFSQVPPQRWRNGVR